MVELAQQHGIKPVLCSITPAKEFFWNTEKQPAEAIRTLNALIQDYATANALLYVNFYSMLKNAEGGIRAAFSDDGVHPNNLGYSAMEMRLEPVLATL